MAYTCIMFELCKMKKQMSKLLAAQMTALITWIFCLLRHKEEFDLSEFEITRIDCIIWNTVCVIYTEQQIVNIVRRWRNFRLSNRSYVIFDRHRRDSAVTGRPPKSSIHVLNAEADFWDSLLAVSFRFLQETSTTK